MMAKMGDSAEYERVKQAAPSEIQAKQNAAHAMLALAAGSSSPILQTPCRHIELLKNLCSKYKLGEPNYEPVGDEGTVRLRVGQHERIVTASSGRLAKELATIQLYTYLHDLYGSSTEIFDKAKQNAAHAMLAPAAGSSSPILQTSFRHIELLKNLCSKYNLGEPNYELASEAGTAQLHCFAVRLRVGQYERFATASSGRLAKELASKRLYTYLHDLYGSSTEIFDKAAPSKIQATQNAAHAMLALAAGSSSPILQTPCRHIELLKNLCSKYKLGEPNYELASDAGTAQPHRFAVCLCVGQYERFTTASSARLAKELVSKRLYTYLHDLYGSSTEIFDKAAPSEIQAKQNAAHAMLALAAGSSSPILQTPCTQIELLSNLCSKYKLGEPNYELVGDEGTAQPHRFTVRLRVGQHERVVTASSGRLAKELATIQLYTYLHDRYGSSTEIFD